MSGQPSVRVLRGSATTSGPGFPRFVCPLCRGALDEAGSGSWRCPACSRTYPEVAGIVDFRVASDRYLSLEEDRSKAEQLAAMDGSSDEMIAQYWRLTPEVPQALAARYSAPADQVVGEAEAWLSRGGAPRPGDAVLEVGCGRGAMLVALARSGASVTGVDIALRWLVVARKLCEERGMSTRLVAADGGLLPFGAGSFERTVSLRTVEHAADQRSLVQGCLLATADGGTARVVLANRFSLGPDPAVGLLGLGYLPRRAVSPYVRWRRNTRYGFFRPLSVVELGALVGLRDDMVVGTAPLPPLPPASAQWQRAVAAVHEGLRRRPGTHRALRWFSPYLQVTGRVGVDEPRRP